MRVDNIGAVVLTELLSCGFANQLLSIFVSMLANFKDISGMEHSISKIQSQCKIAYFLYARVLYLVPPVIFDVRILG